MTDRGLLTTNDFLQLPVRALLALSSRSARRTQPLYAVWIEAKPQWVKAVDEALRLTEQSTQIEPTNPTAARELLEAVTAAAEAAYSAAAKAAAAARRLASNSSSATLASYAGGAAHAAADAAADADYPGHAAQAAWAAWRYSARASSEATTLSRRDYQLLKSLQLGQPGELGQVFDPTETGPLGPFWSEHIPPWWDEGLQKTQDALRSPSKD